MKDQRYPAALMPRPSAPKNFRPKRKSVLSKLTPVLVAALIVTGGLFSLPTLLAVDLSVADNTASLGPQADFPVTVDPNTKTITTDPAVEALLTTAPTKYSASTGVVRRAFQLLAIWVSEWPAYQQLAGVAGVHNLFVTVHSGDRQAQVASEFGTTLGWTAAQRAEFVKASTKLEPDLPDGAAVPGIYFASVSNPDDVAALVHQRFNDEIRSRYSTTTEEQLPLSDAMTVASMLQRESGGWNDMRLISGVIWNRIFAGMNLQIDATLQYAKATQTNGAGGWWPQVLPKDKFIKSAYNTYLHNGLPPGPIASPSVAAVLAALNPKKTDCLFYFHDQNGQFHCTKTYAEHVAMLKKYYGQGK